MSRHWNVGDRDRDNRNEHGYLDPTACEAIKNVDNIEKKTTAKTCKEVSEDEKRRFDRLLGTIFYICELAGFKLEGRIVLVDKKTGRRWE